MLVAVALASTACVRQTVVGPERRPHRLPNSSPVSGKRQIRNAKDAGEGDYQLRVLREKIASDAESIRARLELAKAYPRNADIPICAGSLPPGSSAGSPSPAISNSQSCGRLYDLHRGQDAIAGLEKFLSRANPQQAPQYYSWAGFCATKTANGVRARRLIEKRSR